MFSAFVFDKLIINRRIGLGLIALTFSLYGYTQCNTGTDIWNKLESIENTNDVKKLNQAKALLLQFERCGFAKDSVYARLLERIGLFSYNTSKDLSIAIRYATMALAVNKAAKNGYSAFVSAKAYTNLGIYYVELGHYTKAISFYDSAIQTIAKHSGFAALVFAARSYKCNALFNLGDYQKCREDATIGISEASDSESIIHFYMQRAQALFKQSLFKQADGDADFVLRYSPGTFYFAKAKALNTKALVAAVFGQNKKADSLFSKARKQVLQSGVKEDIADLYTDYGNFLVDSVKKNDAGITYYKKAADYYEDDQGRANAYINMSQVSWRQDKLLDAKHFFLKALEIVKLDNGKNLLYHSTAEKWNLLANKNLLFVMLNNKTELLLTLFKSSGDKKYLEAALQIVVIGDSVITMNRHEQVGEQSKLYWRNRTREFYTNALEACYLAQNKTLAFFFMEKSRAVLLNDKLNELGAAAHLPGAAAAKEQSLQINIITQQERLIALNANDPAYTQQQLTILNAKEELEQFIKSLEKRYPLYYEYRYEENVPSLSSLQEYLANNKQQFVHYFINDTLAYILSISPTGTNFLKLSRQQFASIQLQQFVNFCSDKNRLNANYSSFSKLANNIYIKLFQPIKTAQKRIIICVDNCLIPFEALSTDKNGKHFLGEDYAFSYVYSASVLLRQTSLSKPEGNFLGIAPASFSKTLHVADLQESEAAIKKASGYFNDVNLITGNGASRKNFMNALPKYALINIFSHAYADSTGSEPLLYMQDSVIHLSELEIIRNPAAQLVILSACETNVGKTAAGEGIYSIARGFAAVGVPAAAATLWKADEAAIYEITAMFNENLSKGMPKDIALQLAKKKYMEQNNSEKKLPYYWANLILLGNTDPVILNKTNHNKLYVLLSLTIIFCCASIIIIKRKMMVY